MQNGRGEYRYTASKRPGEPDSQNNRGSGQTRSGQAASRPAGSASRQPNAASSGNVNRQPGAAQSGSANRNQSAPRSTNADRKPNVPRTGNTNRPSGASANHPARQGTNLPSAPRSGHAKTTAVASRGEVGVAEVPKSGKGLVGYWKSVFRLTTSERRESDVVPRIMEGYDYVFLILVLVLLAFGSVMVYSASYAYAKTRYGDSYYIITRQAVFIAVGLVLMFIASRVPPDLYKRFAPLIYLACFFMLCLVPIPGIGVYKKGARRWLNIGIDFQPSEAMKFGLAIMLAWYFDRYQKRVRDYTNFWRSNAFGLFFPYLIVCVTCFLIVLEKHLSGTIIMFIIGTIIIFAGGAMKRVLFGLFGAGSVALLIFGLTTDYTKRRFDLWLHPENHPQDGGWQTLQGLYAIGSGGFFGVGIGESRQKHMYVSEPQNDFIFTIVCEELGFIGAIAVIALFMLFIYRGIVIAMRAPDTFSSLLVAGIIGKVAVQAILNIAVVTGSIPNTGISLPFFSYGGTSLCILMAEMGVVLSISRYSKQIK